MNVLHINAVPYGSTAQIAKGLSLMAQKNGYDPYMAFGYSYHPMPGLFHEIKCGNVLDKTLHLILGRVTGFHGCFSRVTTRAFLRKLPAVPSVIHLHNLHGWYLNLPLLFRYIKKHRIPVVWTFHDCWAFTGHCPHFAMVKCDRWKTGCQGCPQYRDYPECLYDHSKMMYGLKKEWFTGVENLTIVTPSQWLADLVKESFLKDYPVKVIHNGIDLNVFRPTPGDFRQRYGIPEGKKILLGVAFGWGVRKGLDVFVELAKRLDPEQYQIVLVGTDDRVDRQLPENIISIHRTNNQQELAQIYTAADLFVNPTREENYPTVNMESIACGTPVLTFRTGGSPEILDELTGAAVDCDDLDGLEEQILRICSEKPFSRENCLKRAVEFDANERFQEYIRLYGSMLHES